MIHPDDRDAAAEAFQQAMQDGVPYDIDYRIIRPDGIERCVRGIGKVETDETGRILNVYGTGQDITEQKRAEQALRESRDGMVMAQEIANLGNWNWDVATGNVYWSDQFYRILGFEPGQVEPSAELYWQVIHPDDLPHEREASRIALSSPGNVYDVEHRIVRPDGTERVVRSKGKVTSWNEDNQPLYMIGTTQDITDRKQAEEALQRLAAFNESIIQSMAEGIIMADARGVLTFVNPATEDLLGYAPHQLVGSHWTAFVPPDQQPIIQAADERRLRSGADRYEVEMVHQDGQRVSVLVSGTPRLDADGQFAGTLAVFTDITERKRAEEALRWESAVNAALASMAQAMISPSFSIQELADLTLDYAKELTGSEHGYVSAVDPQTGDNVGYTLTEMMGDSCLATGPDQRIVFPVGPDGHYAALWGYALNTGQAFYTNAPQTHEASRGIPPGHIPLRNFLTAPAMIGDSLLGQIALSNAPTEYTDRDLEVTQRLAALYALALQRKRAEEGLEQESQLRAALLDNIPDCIALILKKDSREIVASNRFARQLGAVPGQTCYQTCAERDDNCPFCLAPELWETSKQQRIEVKYRGVWYEGIWAPLSEDLYVHYIFDITERKQAEKERERLYLDLETRLDELRETQSQLIQSAKLAAVGELAAGVAHELNNPLTSIMGFSNLLLWDAAPDDAMREDLETIVSEANRARTIVRNLLTFARQVESHPEISDLNQVIQETLALVQRHIESDGIEIVEQYAPDLPTLRLDVGRMKQVFLNLINNAHQAMAQGDRLFITSQQEGEELAVQIRDTGRGIPEEHLDQIFEPFFTTKPVGQGTGLGLSVSMGIVHDHDGRIEVESQVGQGTTFTVWLPIETRIETKT